MKKSLFTIGVFITSFVLEYLLIDLVLVNADFSFGAGVSFSEQVLYFLPIIVMIILTIVSCICGKRFFKDWKRKGLIITIVTPVLSTIAAFVAFVLLHP